MICVDIKIKNIKNIKITTLVLVAGILVLLASNIISYQYLSRLGSDYDSSHIRAQIQKAHSLKGIQYFSGFSFLQFWGNFLPALFLALLGIFLMFWAFRLLAGAQHIALLKKMWVRDPITHVCPVCGKGDLVKYRVVVNRERSAPIETSYFCERCNKRFKEKKSTSTER